MITNKIPFALLAVTLKEAGADHIETITIEQATQIHNVASLKEKVGCIVDEIKESATNNSPSSREEIVGLLSNIDIAFTSLIGSLGVGKTEVTKAANIKITEANKPKSKAKAKKEEQIDIEDELKSEDKK